MSLPALNACLPALCAIVLLSACGTQARDPRRTDACFEGFVNEDQVQEILRSAPDCCRDIAALAYEPIREIPAASVPGPPSDLLPASPPPPRFSPFFVHISQASPTFTFVQGKSRLAAMDLGPLPRPAKSLTLVPMRSGLTSLAKTCFEKKDGQGERFRYFRPLVTFLDAARRPLAEGLEGIPAQVMIHAALRFEVPDGARFVVVHSAPAAFGTRIRLAGSSRVDLMPVAGTALMLPTRVDGSIDGLTTATGLLEVHID